MTDKQIKTVVKAFLAVSGSCGHNYTTACSRCVGGWLRSIIRKVDKKGGSINPREAELLAASKGMDQVVNQILREHGRIRKGPATDWGIVNDGLVRIGRAVAAYNDGICQKRKGKL